MMKLDANTIANTYDYRSIGAQLGVLAPKELESLGAQLFQSQVRWRGGLTGAAEKLRNLGREMPLPQWQSLVTGFLGTNTLDPQLIANLANVAQNVRTLADGTVEIVPRAGFFYLSNDQLRAFATTFAGKDVRFSYQDGEVLAERDGAHRARPLGRERREEMMKEASKRFDAVRDIRVNDGRVMIEVGNAFDSKDAMERFVHRFFGEVPFTLTRKTDGDKPLFEIGKDGKVAAWVSGIARLPLLLGQGDNEAARQALGANIVHSVYPDPRRRSLSLVLAPWATKEDAKKLIKDAAKLLGADTISAYATSGLTFTYGKIKEPEKLRTIAMDRFDAATKRARRSDAGVLNVCMGTFGEDWRMRSMQWGSRTGELSGNAIVIRIGPSFDLAHSDRIESAVRELLGVAKTYPLAFVREGSVELATTPVPKEKDSYYGLRSDDLKK